MKKYYLNGLIIVLGCLGFLNVYALPTPQKQCEVNGISYSDASTFVNTLKENIKNNDKVKLANMMSYPVRINNSKQKSSYIKTAKQFVINYPTIFNGKLKEAILRNNRDIFCNYQGAMIANGRVWFTTTDSGMKIISINTL